MKTIKITPFLLALSLLVSCSSDGDDGPDMTGPQDATLTLAIAPGSILTKATVAKVGETQEGEAKINNIFGALFKEDGSLLTTAYVDYKNQTEKTPDTIRISAKSDTPYKYVVLVNAGNINCSNMDDLLKKSYNLTDVKVDNQPMGSNFLDITGLKPGTNYYGEENAFTNKPVGYSFYNKNNVKVYRIFSRIDFEKISINWNEDNAADLLKENARFRLNRVYVVDAKSAVYLADHQQDENNNSVEIITQPAYLHGRAEGDSYLASLNLFPRNDESSSSEIINSGGEWDITTNPLRCYITENTEATNPTMLVLKGDILHQENDAPILSDRYFFIELKDMKDTVGKELSGILRNYVIRISATITGKGSGDEEYRENAYATVTVIPDDWSVETQKENVN